jgi:hypothetical protein
MARHGTVEDFQFFDVHQLHRAGALTEQLVSFELCSFKWPGLFRVTANRWRVDVEFRGGALQRIAVVWSRCNFGGGRPWLICRRCNRRVGKLYNTGASLTCRRCLDLWYASQRRGAQSRRCLQALKLRLRLNGIANLRKPFPERPKRMHERTYKRLSQRLESLERQLCHSPRFIERETDYSVLVPK